MAVLPVYNMITVPESNLYLRTEMYQKMTGKTPAVNEKITIIIQKNNIPVDT